MATPNSTQSRRLKLTRATVEGAKPGQKYYELRDTDVPGLVLRIEPTGSKRWKLRRGKKTLSLGRFPDLTLTAARERAKAASRGEWPPAEPEPDVPSPDVPTFIDYLKDTYLPWVEVNHRGSEEDGYRLGKMAAGNLGPLRLDQITLATIDQWRTARRRAGFAASTLNRDLTALRGALQHAVTLALIAANPAATMKPLETDRAGVVRYLDPDEERRLYAALERSEPFVRAIVIVALHTGIRRGEAFGLVWGDIDLKAGRLTVRGSGAKSGQTRHIPLNSTAIDSLLRWRGDAVPLPTMPVFPHREFKKSWATVLRRAGIESFRFHDTRHHFASKLVMAGVDLNTVRELLGHSTLTMTLRYAHLAPQHKAAAVALLVGE